ncbi:MAG: baseplate J/gp47 family protein [Planctomycetota bacterium]
MPFERPLLADLKAQAKQEVASRLSLGALLPRSPLGALAVVQAGQAHMLHGHLAFLALQLFPDTAEGPYLERLAGTWKVTRKPATFAAGAVDLTGTAGATAPAGTKLVRADGVEYELDAAVVLAGPGAGTGQLTASTAGELGEADAGVELTLSSPIAGVSSTATVGTGGLGGGEDEESDDDLRARLLQRIQNVPEGGSAADYVRWALEVAGITRAWTLPGHFGAGTVGVMVVEDDETDILPDAAKLAEVQAYLEERRPVTAAVTAFAPTLVNLDPEIQLTPSNATVQEAVESALRDLILLEAKPGGTLALSRITEAISNAEGETDHTLVSPTAAVTVEAGQLLTLGTVTWS